MEEDISSEPLKAESPRVVGYKRLGPTSKSHRYTSSRILLGRVKASRNPSRRMTSPTPSRTSRGPLIFCRSSLLRFSRLFSLSLLVSVPMFCDTDHFLVSLVRGGVARSVVVFSISLSLSPSLSLSLSGTPPRRFWLLTLFDRGQNGTRRAASGEVEGRFFSSSSTLLLLFLARRVPMLPRFLTTRRVPLSVRARVRRSGGPKLSRS
ncbi:hypothetical protein VP1G_11460 [Cytospora mali]|uniref:Uncharacterized protein n=1 Tax=Cytospora mali TaxID=578113 RepID=A0A194VGA6_CYTMA|nr:hypothetical protein VP1G_11460 [Valsa mali var. pyri (nom. inval.)]